MWTPSVFLLAYQGLVSRSASTLVSLKLTCLQVTRRWGKHKSPEVLKLYSQTRVQTLLQHVLEAVLPSLRTPEQTPLHQDGITWRIRVTYNLPDTRSSPVSHRKQPYSQCSNPVHASSYDINPLVTDNFTTN